MSVPQTRLLLLAHAGSASASFQALQDLHPDAELDVLLFGRAASTTPAVPAAARMVSLPGTGEGRARAVLGLARFTLSLWARRYDRAAIGLLDLRFNQSRGALLGLALLSGAREAFAISPHDASTTAIMRRPALAADALRFVAFQLLGRLAARVLAAGLAPIGVARTRPPAPEPPSGGRVIYLRTDVELRMAPLRAGGSLAHTMGILHALRRRGHSVDLLTTGEVAGARTVATEHRIPVLLKGNVSRELCEFASGIAQGLAPIADGPRPEFVYQRTSMNNLAGLMLARRLRVPLVLEANASEVQWREEWSSLRHPALGRACERVLLRQADRIAAVSENAAGHLRTAGAPADRLRVVPNGVEVQRFAGAQPLALPFPGSACVIAFTGLFYPWHGVSYLAQAFTLVAERRPDARLLLVGDGEDAARVRHVLENAGVLAKTLMTGLVGADAVPRYLAAADIVVSPHAADESFIGSPIKLWEYMASGRAIVASSVAQLSDVIADGRTGLLVPPRDPDALAAALVRLCDDPQLRARLGSAAQAEASAHHSWEARLQATLTN
jgi:glycosyltransferase involved in cell wall biosynthesis